MFCRRAGGIVLAIAIHVAAEVVSYECDLLPTEDGWKLQDQFCDPEEWVEDGSFFQYVQICDDPKGEWEQSFFRRFLMDFLGTKKFFAQFRMETTGDQKQIPLSAPVALALGSQGPTRYNFVIARDQVKFNRDNLLPILFFDIEPGVPHTYRIELDGAESYILFIDGVIVDQGKPEGQYPSSNPRINFGARAALSESTAEWQYIRYGDTPVTASGDFDSENGVTLDDYYFFQECAENSGAGVDAGPGCVWADMDGDNDVDLLDFGLFQVAFGEAG